MSDEPHYPGAESPQRRTAVSSAGLRINVVEWGDPAAPPCVLCHGMFDHAMGFATLAPLLAERFRVVAIDARGHGDSQWADCYSWPTDVLDIVNVLRWVGGPSFLVGHSKGGGQATDAATAAPELVRKVVNIDGFGPPPLGEDQLPTPQRFVEFLDHRRAVRGVESWRAYDTLDDLARRRGAQNPRLVGDWLRYFSYHGARRRDDGWVWKSDPYMARHFVPWKPEWIAIGYRALSVPLLAITGTERDTWGPLPDAVLEPRLAGLRDHDHVRIDGAGHFVHMEKPAETAAAILDYFDA